MHILVHLQADALREELLEYMIPYLMARVDEFPLTPNKKMDRKELSLRNVKNLKLQSFNAASAAAMKNRLFEFLKEVLKIEGKVAITYNLFGLGRHSLNALIDKSYQ